MHENCSFYTTDTNGNYRFTRSVAPEEVLVVAERIMEARLSRGETLSNPRDTTRFLSLKLGRHEREVFACLFLDNRHRVIQFEELFAGTIDGTCVHPREVVKRALKLNAAAVILSHNHPSGVAEPSPADRAITKRLKTALALIDVRVLDHVIVAGTSTVSLAEMGLV